MKTNRAIEVCKNLNDDNISYEDKLEAVRTVAEYCTPLQISKIYLLSALRFIINELNARHY